MRERLIRIQHSSRAPRRRPVMLAIAGDSASGKTTLAAGLAAALGRQRCVSLSTDDYHRYDRTECADQPATVLHPDNNHIDILAQHLQLLATGQPVLKPVYDHHSGRLLRPQLLTPAEFVIVEGVLSLHSKLARACFDVTVYLDPADEVRRGWKVQRDTMTRGYTAEQVRAELAARAADAAAFVQPQRAHADLVVRFAPIAGRDDPPDTPMSASLLLRPTIDQPDLTSVLVPEVTRTMHMRLTRDSDGRPVDSVHVHGYTSAEEGARTAKVLWYNLTEGDGDPPDCLGRIGETGRSTPLALTQMILLAHLLRLAL